MNGVIECPFNDVVSSEEWEQIEKNLEFYHWALEFPGCENYMWKDIAQQPIPFYIFFSICTKIDQLTDAEIEKFKSNRHQCWENGLEYGIVYDFDVSSMHQATKSAELVVSMLNELNQPQLPVFCKITRSFARKTFSYKLRTQLIAQFCETIEQFGYKAGIQISEDFRNMLAMHHLCRYDLWITMKNARGVLPIFDKCAVQFKRFILNPCKYIGRDREVEVYGSAFFTQYASRKQNELGWNSKFDPTNDNTVHTRFYVDKIHYISNRWLCINGNWYCFNMAGDLITDRYYKYHNRWYYLAKNGLLIPGMSDPTEPSLWYFNLRSGEQIKKRLLYVDDDAARLYPILIDNTTYVPIEQENSKLWNSHIAFYEMHKQIPHSQS